MNSLPHGWIELPLTQILEKLVDGSHNPPPKEPTGMPMLSAKNIFDHRVLFDDYRLIAPEAFELEHRRTGVSAHDVLLTIVGAIGRTAVVPHGSPSFALQRSVAVLRPHVGIVPSYLARYLSAPRQQIWFEQNAKGTAQRGIYLGQLSRLPVSIPPFREQCRIVAKLDALDASAKRARADLDRIPTLVARAKQAILTEAFSSATDTKKVGEVVSRIEAGKNLRCMERPPLPHELGVVKVSAVTWGEFSPLASKTLPDDYRPPEDIRIRSGDFLFSRANTLELVGACVIVGEAPDNLFLSDKILRLVLPDDLKSWLKWFLRSDSGRAALEAASSGNQMSMRNISQKALLEIEVPFAPKKARAEIVHRIEAAFAKIDRIAAEAGSARALLDRLDQAILAKAFRGELVPQDPSDEPAEKLLEKIKAARAAPPARKTRNKQS